jgi:hypothetical protein
MEVPVLNESQFGASYYYSPLSVYNLGMVDQANKQSDGEVKDLMYCHVYHEGVGSKGGNNVCSLVLKTLQIMHLLRENDPGLELNIIFDNCSGQNKNNTVLKMVLWLVEMKYFQRVNFVFLVVGHTKNAADRLFNALKLDYRKQNLYTMKQLLLALSRSKYCRIIEAKEEDFKDWGAYFDLFYRNYRNKKLAIIKQNHIFSCDYLHCFEGNQLMVHVRESDLPSHAVMKVPMIKNGFYGRYGFDDGRYGLEDYQYDKKMPIKKAVDARGAIMRGALSDKVKVLQSAGINIYKQVEMYKNYRKYLPLDVWEDELYVKPADNILQAVKEEKLKRNAFRIELNKDKKMAAKVAKKEPKGEVKLDAEEGGMI